MKIERVEALPLNAKIDKPFRIATTLFDQVRALVVRVTTDEGVVGIGECVVRAAPKGTKHIVEDMLAPLILGKDPLDAAGLWWDMFSAMRTRGHTKGHFVEAISGVDVAIWDIIGKSMGLPVYKAMNGFGRKVLPTYGSSVFCDEPDKMVDGVQGFLDRGYNAVKIKLGMGLKKDAAAIEAIRRAIGDDVMIMVDINSKYDAATAVRLGRLLEPYDVEWLEEPVPPYDLKGYAKVKQGQTVPVAGGEGEFSLFGFRDFLATGAVDVVQPDLGRVGGLTEGMRIAALVQSENLSLAPHTGMFSALNVVVAMHFSAAAPNFKIFEFMEVSHPLMDIFTEPMPRPVNGELHLPEAPGLGVELDMDKIKPYIES